VRAHYPSGQIELLPESYISAPKGAFISVPQRQWCAAPATALILAHPPARRRALAWRFLKNLHWRVGGGLV